ncbi:MAG: NAD(P)/FAD-dependent oxidoreductase, partial [Candidatus Bathyarchaeia archaeon]
WEESRLLPLWPLAYIGGRVAGSNMAGVRTVYQGGTQMSALNYFGLPVISIGVVNPPEDETYEIISSLDREKRTYRKIVLKNNTLRGVILVGKIDNAGVIFDLLKNKVDVSEFKDRILSEDFGLIHLTEPLRREMLRRN